MKKFKDIVENLSSVSVGTWVRGILLIISFINMALSTAGKAPIPADYNEIYTIVSIIFAILVGAMAYWKNNSFTAAAQAADEFFHAQGQAHEQGEVTPDETENANEE
nr:MAG TPA: holin [Caudoviricetes sp.]